MAGREGVTTQQVYYFLVDFVERNGFPPTTQEIADAMELNSTATAKYHLDSLEAKGFIKQRPRQPRAITLIGYKSVCVDKPLIHQLVSNWNKKLRERRPA